MFLNLRVKPRCENESRKVNKHWRIVVVAPADVDDDKSIPVYMTHEPNVSIMEHQNIEQWEIPKFVNGFPSKQALFYEYRKRN